MGRPVVKYGGFAFAVFMVAVPVVYISALAYLFAGGGVDGWVAATIETAVRVWLLTLVLGFSAVVIGVACSLS